MMNLYELPFEEKQAHRVTSQKEICRVLGLLASNHALMTVMFTGSKKPFGSMVLAVSSSEENFIIDSIVPHITYNDQIKRTPFALFGTLDGIHIEFNDLVLADGKFAKHMECKLPLPKEMIYIQRRRAYRAYLPLSHKIEVEAKNDRLTFVGNLSNLSVSGCQIMIDGNLMTAMQHNPVFERALFKMADETEFRCTVEAVHITYNEAKNKTVAGCRFDFFDTDTERMVAKYVNLVQIEANRQKFK